MPRAFRILPIALLFLLGAACTQPQAEPVPELTGDHVANITRMFLRNHYSRLAFDDTHSADMLALYVDRYDPARYYFLQSDVNEFKRQANALDDQIRRGDIELAFTIYRRFLKRLKERETYIAKALESGFDLGKDETFEVSRKDAPFPADENEARRLFHQRLKREMLELTLRGQSQQEATESLRRRYRSLHFRFVNFTSNDVVTAFLNAFTSAYDPHSSYLSQDDLENFNISMRLSLEGIGATLRWEDGYTVISSIIPGGAAAREGSLLPEDKIVAVGEGTAGAFEDVTNHRLIDVVKLIRGERGTTVRLTFLRKAKGVVEKRHEVAIVRDRILLKDGEASSRVLEHPRPDRPKPFQLGVINLPSFYVDFAQRNSDPSNYKSAARDVENALRTFLAEAVDGVVLDLRNNGGGGLDEAVSLAGLFLGQGPIVMVKDVRGRISRINNPHDRPVYKGPLIVLINRYSASASEIVAGALQDYGRAVIVGDRATFGKGTVQNIINLPHGLGALKTTVAKFYRPGGASTQHRGVEADIVLPSLNNALEIGESSLENPLPWDTVTKASFPRWADLDALIPALREHSNQRQDSKPYFRQVKGEVRDFLASRKDRKQITLRQMIRENEQNLTQGMQAVEDGAGAEAAGEMPGHDPAPGEDKAPDDRLAETLDIMGDYLQLQAAPATRTIATGRS